MRLNMALEPDAASEVRFKYWRIVAILALVALTANLLWRPIRIMSANPGLRNNVNSIVLHHALRNYADFEHTLPARLNDLVPKYLDADSGYVDPESLAVYDWLYFPPTGRSVLSKDYILFAQPGAERRSGRRMVLRAGKGREWLEEGEYQRIIKIQIDASAAPIPNLKLP
jgi:hypothetical protein